MSRYGRVLPDGAYYVHVMSRVVDRRFALGPPEKEHFRRLMRAIAAFCGLEVVTYCIMDNHFHILVYVPQRQELDDVCLLRRLELVWAREHVEEVRQRLQRFKGYSNQSAYFKERQKHLARMYDLGQFMKALKQQFTRWYNRRHERTGTLWEARYKSVVVEGAGDPLLTMATYVDLNPLRAGICMDPERYHWCGYGEAMAGGLVARDGLTHVARVTGGSLGWRMVQRRYRTWLYATGEEKGLTADGMALRRGFCRANVQKVWETGGKLDRSELLRCRVRYFSDGVALGSRAYLERLFEHRRNHFGKRRKTGSRRIRGSGFEGLYTLRDLQVRVVT